MAVLAAVAIDVREAEGGGGLAAAAVEMPTGSGGPMLVVEEPRYFVLDSVYQVLVRLRIRARPRLDSGARGSDGVDFQAPRAWYETLSTYLISEGFTRGKIDSTLFVKTYKDHVFLAQIYVDDIIFGSTKAKLCKKFETLKQAQYKMSMMGELTYFLGLQVKQSEKGIFISQASRPDIMYATCLCARYQADPKESHMKAVKRCKIDRKSTTGGCQLLGGKLVSWTSKKQNLVSTSTAEAEYVAAGSCCAQVLWMRNQLLDYGFQLSKIPIYCDNTSAIAIANNPVLHSKTKHIEIRYHFIRDHVMNGDVELHFVPTEYQLADLFTKPLDEKRFNQLISELGMLNPDV
ncbi:hypothetical protein OSB04_017457 [Centaurea solstitialis]|uniref:Reverse transcriptase Ty1/copia-type domain-containing protein n=1 Tax=Centaurea solstitialis TaxID=347529 RepID=A0AA38WAQ0_9ASTR|nr:hypothetical protein OSB04_017457 [Centaurea solstitialis]